MSRCVIISACPVSPELTKALRPDDFIIACDAGYRNCAPLGCRPNIIVGDFDTAPCPEQQDDDIVVLPHVKDDTDTEYAAKLASEKGFDEVLQELSRRVSPRILHSPSHLDGLAAQFDEYFAGDRHRFDVQLDQRLSTGFRHKVQQYLPRIDYGFTHSYKQVAEKVGNPAAARAVGAACATNPLPIVVPCHRVLRSDGGLGGYVGGLDAKSTLLTSEHARWATRTAGPQTSREDPTTRQPSA